MRVSLEPSTRVCGLRRLWVGPDTCGLDITPFGLTKCFLLFWFAIYGIELLPAQPFHKMMGLVEAELGPWCVCVCVCEHDPI